MKRIFIISCVVVWCQAQEDQEWVQRTLHAMNTRQKVAQLVMPAVPYDPDATGMADQLFTFRLPEGLDREYAVRMVREHEVGGFLLLCEDGSVSNQVALF